MTILQSHQLFKERFNRAASNYHQDFSSYQIDEFLYTGLQQVLKTIVESDSAIQRQGVVGSLLVTAPDQPMLVPVAAINNVYEFNLQQLKYPYFHLERVAANTNCGQVNVVIESYNRLPDILRDHLQRPSKKWSRLIGVIAKSSAEVGLSLYVHSETGFTISSVQFDYLRFPRRPFFGQYDTPDFLRCQELNGDCTGFYSAGSPPVDIDLHPNFHDNIVDAAVKEAARSLGLVNEFQLASDKTGVITN